MRNATPTLALPEEPVVGAMAEAPGVSIAKRARNQSRVSQAQSLFSRKSILATITILSGRPTFHSFIQQSVQFHQDRMVQAIKSYAIYSAKNDTHREPLSTPQKAPGLVK